MPLLVDRERADAVAVETILRLKGKRRRAEKAIDPADITAWVDAVYGMKEWHPGAEHGGRYIYPKQLEMLNSVAEHAQVSVCGSNGSGKDFTTAHLAPWWIKHWQYRGEPAMVIITAPTFRQIQHIIWQELRHAYLNACSELGGTLYEQPLLKWDEQTFIYGFSTDKPYQIQGFHSPHLLVICSEAHGIAQSHFNVLWRLNPNCMLLTGNPISEAGEFYDSHHGKSHNWHTISIDAWDTPNVIEGTEVVPGLVTKEDIERGKRNWGEDSPLFRITFKNEWVEGMGQMVVVPLSVAQRAEDNWEAEAYPIGQVGVVACDVARHGQDKTVIYLRRGRVAKLLWRVQGAPTDETADWLIDYHKRHPFHQIVVDGVGVGGGVIDQLRKAQVGVIEFQGGAAASDSARYWDRNAEVWWRMREAYQSGMAIMPDAETRAQVSSRRYKIEKDRRVRLERKEDMKKEGRHSPDEADALAMTFVLDYHLEGQRLTADSDVDAPPPDEMDETQRQERDSLGFSRGSDMAGYAPSRWSKLRGGHRR